MWPKFLRNYFGFTKQQGRGFFVLVLLCALIVLFRLLFPFFEPEPQLVLKNLPYLPVDTNTQRQKNSESPHHKKRQTKEFNFDPNSVSQDELTQLGLKPSSAKALLNFRKKGFVFREKRDFAKVYGISAEDYKRLEPYIVIQEEVQANNQKQFVTQPVSEPVTQKQSAEIIEINSADSITLLKLKGIGPSFAKRIIKYRDLLGGFIAIEQLKEVYGLDEALFEKIKPFVRINSELIRKLHLNSDDFKTLNRHPYLSYELTKQLVNRRKNKSLDKAALIDLIHDEALFLKLSPYCSFE